MTGIFRGSINVLLNKRFRRQTFLSAFLELLIIVCSAVLIYGIWESPHAGVTGENRFVILAAFTAFLCGFWYLVQRREYKVSICVLMWVPVAFYIVCVHGCSVLPIMLLNGLLIFITTNFLLRRRDYYIMFIVLIGAAIVSLIWGIREHSELKAIEISENIFEYYISPAISSTNSGGVGAITFLLCICLPFPLSVFFARRYSNGTKCAAIIGFAAVWYGIFRCGNLAALFYAMFVVISAPFVYISAERGRAKFSMYMCVLAFGTLLAFSLDRLYACLITKTPVSTLFDLFSARIKSVLAAFKDISFFGNTALPHTDSTAVNFLLFYGVFGFVLVALPIVFISICAAKVWRKTPIEKLAGDGFRYQGQSIREAFGPIRRREYSFVSTPFERIVRGNCITVFVGMLYMIVFGGRICSLSVGMLFSIVCGLLMFSIYGVLRVKKYIMAFGIAFIALFVLWGIGIMCGYDCSKNLTGRTYYDRGADFDESGK